LINFNRRNGFDAVSEDAFAGETLSITEETFQRAVAILGVDVQAGQIPDCPNRFGLEKTDFDRIRQASANLFEFSRSGSTTTNFMSSELQDELALAIVAAIAESVTSHRESSYSKRQQAVNRALEIINSTHCALSIQDLFQDSASSWRTLDRGFRERFGVTPKQYILATRMASARREILASPPERRITDIANNWGFWHLGRFSIEYKRLFGESPSATMRR
jgi:AraC-like DNA-binding protein